MATQYPNYLAVKIWASFLLICYLCLCVIVVAWGTVFAIIVVVDVFGV